jgi:hypothetical protein
LFKLPGTVVEKPFKTGYEIVKDSEGVLKVANRPKVWLEVLNSKVSSILNVKCLLPGRIPFIEMSNIAS